MKQQLSKIWYMHLESLDNQPEREILGEALSTWIDMGHHIKLVQAWLWV